MHKVKITLLIALLFMLNGNGVMAAEPPVVVELFTSQGCSSCPSADALLRDVAGSDKAIIALSFHVDYWDYLGWKDLYSSPENTNRQRRYAQTLNDRGVYTPQAVINGVRGIVGSNESQLRSLISDARQTNPAIAIDVKAAAPSLNIHLPANALSIPAKLYAVTFKRNTSTDVQSGENSGRRLNSINSVTHVTEIGAWDGADKTYTFPIPNDASEGIAVLLQEDSQGRIIGAAQY